MNAVSAAVLIATPLLAFLGAVTGHLLGRKGAQELEERSRREESMRMVRWATELSTDHDPDKAAAGLVVLDALLESPWLRDDDVQLVATVTGFVTRGRLLEQESLTGQDDGDDVGDQTDAEEQG